MISALVKLQALFTRTDVFRFGVLLAAMVGGAILEVVGVGAIPVFVTVVLEHDSLQGYPPLQDFLTAAGLTTPHELLVWGSVSLLTLFSIRTAYLLINYYVEIRMIKNRQLEVSKRLFAAYMHAAYPFHLTRNTATLLRNAENEVRRLFEDVVRPLIEALRHAIVVTAILLLLAVSEPVVTVAVFLILGAGGGGFMALIYGKTREYGRREQQERERQIKTVQEGLGAIKEARVLGKEEALVQAFSESTKGRFNLERYTQMCRRSTLPIMEYVAVVGLLLIVLMLVFLGRSVDAVAPTVALFAVALARLKGSVQDLMASATRLRYNLSTVHPIYNDLRELCGDPSSNAHLAARPQPPPLRLRRELTVRDVSYRYPSADSLALQGISLTIRQGDRIGLVGPTGGGKTTLVDVLLGLLPPDAGAVEVDGQDIRDNLRAWQAGIGYVPQSIYLLDDTVRRNIALGVPDGQVDGEKLRGAVEAAELGPVIGELPAGLDTVIGERGIRLSGGQRQRIGIARALFHQPDILFLDEATSALDNQTERGIMHAVENLAEGGRTVVIISHRLSTVRNCRTLYFIADGAITASGSYDELSRTYEGFQKMIG